ncbi:MAG: hypothetical protein HZC37_01635 [Burkholderiales bacterium]|nr:hypothetical protein [Burkholderiales bacterium]
MLLLWLFGIGSAVANNCLAGGIPKSGGGPHHSGPSTPAVHDEAERSHGGASMGHAVHDRENTTHAPAEPRADANCQDFCNKVSTSQTAPKWGGDDLGMAAAPPPAPFVAATAFDERGQAWAPRPSEQPAPLVRVAFARLAL